MARILVTGGSGFLGSAIIKELELQGQHDITAWDIVEPAIELDTKVEYKDILTLPLGEYSFDCIFHCAAILGAETTFDHIIKTEQVNVAGTLKILEIAGKNTTVIRPGLLGHWLNPYMISTMTAEQYGLMYRKHLEAKFVSCRFTIIYGPGQINGIAQKKAVPIFISQALKNEPIVIYGDGSYKVRLFYIRDAARIMISLMKNYGEVSSQVTATSIWDENYLSVRDLVEKIIRMTGSSSEVIYKPMRKGQPESAIDAGVTLGDTIDLYNKLSFTEQTFLHEGLANAINWDKERYMT